MEELISACDQFLNRRKSLEDLVRLLSWIAVEDSYIITVEEAASKLERIMFTEKEEEWYKIGSIIIKKLLETVHK